MFLSTLLHFKSHMFGGYTMHPHSAEQSSFYKTEGRSADLEETPTMSSQNSHCITGSALSSGVIS